MIRLLCALFLFCAMETTVLAQPGSNLVDPSNATHIAVQNGSWQDTETWDNGIPNSNSQVYIPNNIHVTNHENTADIKWINVDGILDVCTHCNTKINVHTLYIGMSGHVYLGKPGMPVESTAILEYVNGPFLPGDYQKLSLGMICHGEFFAEGLEKTHALVVDDTVLNVGATSLKVVNVPLRWNIGDIIILSGTDSILGEDQRNHTFQSEYLTITGITGKTITFNPPLKYKHFRWRNDLTFHLLNISRNVQIKSRSTAHIEDRGHNMFMSPMNHMKYVAEIDLGRTDKSQPVTDPRIDPINLTLVPNSDINPRARYADHNHRVGPLNAPSTRRGVVVKGSPGWGFLNHASNCQWDECIALECYGFGFGTEEGQERGHIRNCYSCLNKGLGLIVRGSDDDHGSGSDWGKDGAGFWLQGGLVEVSDCVAFDNSGRGFALFNIPMNGYPDFGSGNPQPDYLKYKIIHNGSLLSEEYFSLVHTDSPNVASGAVPQRVFLRNIGYNNKISFQGWSARTYNSSSQQIWPLSVRANIIDLKMWGRGAKFHLEYMRQVNVNGLTIIGDSNLEVMGAIRRYTSSNLDNPIHLRGVEVTIKNLDIQYYFNKDQWPSPKRIYSSWNNGTWSDPHHVVEGTYPIIVSKKDGYELIN